MLVTKKNIKLNNKMKTQQGQDIDTSYWTTLFSFNTEISEEKKPLLPAIYLAFGDNC